MNIKNWFARGLAAGVVLAGSVAGANVASADALKCAWSSGQFGYTCMNIYGTANVTHAYLYASQGTYQENVCGFRARVTAQAFTGGGYATKVYYSTYRSGCAIVPPRLEVPIYASMKNGSEAVGRYYYDGAWQPGLPSITLWY